MLQITFHAESSKNESSMIRQIPDLWNLEKPAVEDVWTAAEAGKPIWAADAEFQGWEEKA